MGFKVHVARLTSLELDKKVGLENITTQRAEEAIKACDAILNEIGNPDDILAFFAIKTDSRSDAADIKKDMERKKGWYLDATSKKGIALCSLDRAEEATTLLFDCLKFVDQIDTKIIFFATVHAECIGHYGRVLKLIQNLLESSSCSGGSSAKNGPTAADLDKKITDIYEKIGWEHASHFTRLS